MFQISDFWYVERQGKLRKSVATAMSEQFHQQLNQLALEVKQYPLADAKQDPSKGRQRKRITGSIDKIISFSPELKKYKRKLFREYNSRDSNVNQAVFEGCYADALQITGLEINQKLDNYNPGEGYILGLDWQAFCQDLQNNSESASALAEDFKEKIDCYRQTIDESLTTRKDYQPKKSEELKSICTNFANSIGKVVEANNHSPEKLESLWCDFSEKISAYDRSKDLFNWFKFILRYRFIDCKNEFLNYKFKKIKAIDPETGKTIINPNIGKPKYRRILIPPKLLDAPISNDSKETIVDTLAAKPDLERTLQKLIEQDPDDIFTAKYSKKYPEVEFRGLQLLHSQDYSCEKILAHFNNRVPLGTISSHYHRSLKYFSPILEEYLTAKFPLTESAIDKIRQDLEIMPGRKKNGIEQKKKPSAITMNKRSNINFQNIIIQRKDNFLSWQALAKHLNLSPKDLILFYLDNLQKSKLYQTREERKQQQ